jgi:uncharacterized protein (DUF924 family)
MIGPAEILSFWFPSDYDKDEATCTQAVMRWFRGGTDEEIRRRFPEITAQALDGGLVEWERAPRERLALILVLDQFPRSLYRESPRAFAGAARVERLVVQTLDAGENRGMKAFEQVFLGVALGHSEEMGLQDRGVALVDAIEFPVHVKKIGELCASQARAHREEIARFGRHPSRNVILGRETTAEEKQYLETEGPAHLRQRGKTSPS